jgi:hypothetical protein
MLREGLFDIDPAFEVVWNEEVLSLGFFSKMLSIKVATGHEDKFTAEQAFVSEEQVHLFECFADWNSCINLFLCDAGQLITERCELGVDGRLDICLIERLNDFLFDVNYYDRELNDLLRAHWVINVVIGTSALEIEDANVVKGSLIKISPPLKVEHHPEVLWRYAAILKAF